MQNTVNNIIIINRSTLIRTLSVKLQLMVLVLMQILKPMAKSTTNITAKANANLNAKANVNVNAIINTNEGI